VLTNHLASNKETIKKLIIPAIVKLLAKFGPDALQNDTFLGLESNVSKSLVKCPSSSQISSLIKQRNQFVKQVNNMYNITKTLTKLSTFSTTLITALNVGITIASLNPYPMPPSYTLKINDLQEKLRKASVTLSIVTLSIASFGNLLGIVLKSLNDLDRLLQQCSIEKDKSYESINTELNDMINTSTGISNSQVINETQSDNNTYKGFKLELKLDTTNKTEYPRRYAQALNKQGVPILKTEPSFASDPQVLLNNLKFIIDSSPNLTTE
jgi:hypothetical protein